MPSLSYIDWASSRRRALDEMEAACLAADVVHRRAAAQHVIQAYTMIVAAQFQGFCRDVHSETVNELTVGLVPPHFRYMIGFDLMWGRQLDRGNAQPSSIGTDFNRLGLSIWNVLAARSNKSTLYKLALEDLNMWRNAIAHQDFDNTRLAGRRTVKFRDVGRWVRACRWLAKEIDLACRDHVYYMKGVYPW